MLDLSALRRIKPDRGETVLREFDSSTGDQGVDVRGDTPPARVQPISQESSLWIIYAVFTTPSNEGEELSPATQLPVVARRRHIPRKKNPKSIGHSSSTLPPVMHVQTQTMHTYRESDEQRNLDRYSVRGKDRFRLLLDRHGAPPHTSCKACAAIPCFAPVRCLSTFLRSGAYLKRSCA